MFQNEHFISFYNVLNMQEKYNKNAWNWPGNQTHALD